MCLMTHQGARGNGVNFSEVAVEVLSYSGALIRLETGASTDDYFLLLHAHFH